MPGIVIRDWIKFGSAVRTARRRQHLSQEQLAERAGVSRSWVAKVESGHRGAEFQQVLRLLAALGMTMTVHEPDSVDDEVRADVTDSPAPGRSGGPSDEALAAYLAAQLDMSTHRRRSWQALAETGQRLNHQAAAFTPVDDHDD